MGVFGFGVELEFYIKGCEELLEYLEFVILGEEGDGLE